ncbi:MAG: mannonate dehydratase [Vicinamibacterales bacterium]|nr:mannonate dehydratase [Vicinamibacterales bacterium]HJO16915.1 mannonate dehydratase [Vicinamibacterales bacterium]
MDRRTFVSLTGGVAGALSITGCQVTRTLPEAKRRPRVRMTVGTQRSPTTDEMLLYFRRHGIEHICGYPETDGWTGPRLQQLRERCELHGISLDMVQFPFMSSSHIDRADRKAIMLGQDPERQKEIDEACEIIRRCSEAGIPAIKYNLSLLGVLRTDPTRGRGGTSYSTWRLVDADPNIETRAGEVAADEMWERITYFLERVIPVAEEYDIRLACHPHDPGVSPEGFHGIARVLGTVDGLKKFVNIKENSHHGLNLCLGTTAEMLENPAEEIHDVIRYFGSRRKIFNIHFRNILGRRDDFQEVFPDEGDMDMVRVMMTLKEVDYPYMVMPDHMPRHPDDPNGRQAFAFGYGYIKGLIQAVDTLA